ncbi:metalloproteinase inhibitor 4-like [Patiria miniata]|uniref:NTR domain-containing protein n=1 Tax=Patiria miniata TaxID=46514 RepID=A0A914ADP3_PATMI|nr:metalloproteinase inhibitor 4-like [Patiria miniata]
MDFSSLSLIFLLFLAYLETTQMVLGCQCAHRHPQQHFCQAEFVIRAKVMSKTFEPIMPSQSLPTTPQPTTKPPWRFPAVSKLRMAKPPKTLRPLSEGQMESWNTWAMRLRYMVQVEKVYKGEETILARSKIEIVSPADSGMCGVTMLEEGQKYLLTGSFSEKGPTIHLCDWVVESHLVTKTQRQGLKYVYKKYCDECIIKPGVIYWPPEAKEKDVCAYNPYLFHENDCAALYSACVRRPSGICEWQVTNKMKRCQKGGGMKLRSGGRHAKRHSVS